MSRDPMQIKNNDHLAAHLGRMHIACMYARKTKDFSRVEAVNEQHSRMQMQQQLETV